jgi:hypothetical protein
VRTEIRRLGKEREGNSVDLSGKVMSANRLAFHRMYQETDNQNCVRPLAIRALTENLANGSNFRELA